MAEPKDVRTEMVSVGDSTQSNSANGRATCFRCHRRHQSGLNCLPCSQVHLLPSCHRKHYGVATFEAYFIPDGWSEATETTPSEPVHFTMKNRPITVEPTNSSWWCHLHHSFHSTLQFVFGKCLQSESDTSSQSLDVGFENS